MTIKSLISNIYSRLNRKSVTLSPDFHGSDTPVTRDSRGSSARKRTGGRSPVDFDLEEALRLRALGWGYGRIARRMNDVSRETVRTRILDFERSLRASEPAVEPIPAPASALSLKSPILPVAPKLAPEPFVPVARATPFGLEAVPAGTKTLFLVNGEQNVMLARNCAQIAVGIERWHPSYATLPAFRDADRILVVINSDDDNRTFFMSIVGDIWIRERCAVSRGDSHISEVRWTWVQQVCKDRLITQRANHGAGEGWWQPQFETRYFVPMPQPNHTKSIDEFLAPPTKHEPDTGGNG
jgi:hypothetical protein